MAYMDDVGFGKVNSHFEKWQVLVSILDFWGVLPSIWDLVWMVQDGIVFVIGMVFDFNNPGEVCTWGFSERQFENQTTIRKKSMPLQPTGNMWPHYVSKKMREKPFLDAFFSTAWTLGPRWLSV